MRLFGTEGFWLRASLPDSENWEPHLKGVYINAVPAQQASSFQQELLGGSAEPNLSLPLSNPSILPDSLELRVRETLSEEEREQLNLQASTSTGDDQAVTQYPDISLEGDWVRWHRVDSFIGRGPEERIFRLDAEKGVITFGNDQGRIPPAGRNNIRAIHYKTGGGLQGNLPAYSITALKSALESVETIANPIAAAGGTASPDLTQQLRGAPAKLRSQQALHRRISKL